jgi:hypothetical protein
MLFEVTTLVLLNRGAKKKQQQIAIAQKQLAIAQAQHVMNEDMIAITAAPIEMRPQILQARQDAREAAQNQDTKRRLICTLVFIVGLVLLLRNLA